MNIDEAGPDENMHDNDLDAGHHERSRRSRRHKEKHGRGAGSKGDGRSERLSSPIYRERPPRSDGSEGSEDGDKRPHTRKLKNSSLWDHSDRGNGEDEHDSESPRDSRQSLRTSDYSSRYYDRRDRHRADRGESERQFPVHHQKSERKRGTSDAEDLEATRSRATDNRIDEPSDERGRWAPYDKRDSA